MLDFCDEPYRFFEPKPNRAVMAVSRVINRYISLPNAYHRVRELEISGQEDFLRDLVAKSSGARLLFVANHATHSDPQVMTELLRRLGARTHFMAAYDVFLRSRLTAWVMQRNGAFSVDREGSDSKGMKTAVRVLSEAPHGSGLTIFPEGNVYLTNDRVTPFLDGAAFIALKSQRRLGPELPIHVVPVALKFTHLDDVREGICGRLHRLAGETETHFDRDADTVAEMMRIGRLLLERNLRKRGLLADPEITLAEQLSSSAEEILSGLEKKLELRAKSTDTPVDRVRKARARLHQLRTGTAEQSAVFAEAHVEAWADEAITAFRILNYGTPYVAENPTMDRFAESSERLMEDHFSKALHPLGDRRVIAHIGEPIDLSRRLEAFSQSSRVAVSELTLDMERAVQAGLDAENAANSAPGGEPFDKS